MKRTTLQKYFLAYVGLAGLAVTIEANATIVTVTPGNPGSWNYETFGYASGVGSAYVANPASPIPIVSSPAAPGTGGSAQLITTVGSTGSARISTTAYNGQLLSGITSLSYAENTVANNGQQNPFIRINISLDGTMSLASQDAIFFEPSYQTPTSGNPSLPNQGTTSLNQWQTWNAAAGGWWDNNGNFNQGTGVGSLAAFLAMFPNAKIMDNSFTPGLGGISIVVGEDGANNEGYVNNVGINGTTYDFEPGSVSAVPEASTIIAGALLLLPFGATMLRKKKAA